MQIELGANQNEEDIELEMSHQTNQDLSAPASPRRSSDATAAGNYQSSSPSRRNSPRWKKAAVISTATLLIAVAIGAALVLTRKEDDRRPVTVSSFSSSINNNDASSASSNTNSNDRFADMDAIEEWIAATVEEISSTPRPTNRIVPRPTGRPTGTTVTSPRPTNRIVPKPSNQPITPAPTPAPTPEPTPQPTPQPITPQPRPQPISPAPTPNPTPQPIQPTISPTCFTSTLYNAIDSDIALLKSTISNTIERSHFLGGIVRLAAHDFMDYDRFSFVPYGPDGCFDPNHASNAGIPSQVWCSNCLLRGLYETKYMERISRADFWIAAANAVIRQTSVNNMLDLRNTFKWGRKDRDSCPGSGDRVPTPASCDDVEGTFLMRMGLEWKDAVALLGAHSLGRGSAENSGHEGVWSDTAEDAMVFDKSYYKELFNNAWHPRLFVHRGELKQDWTLDETDRNNPQMMLNTDLCLIYDIGRANNQCCTREGECRSYRAKQCPMYKDNDSRRDAGSAVVDFIGDSMEDDDNMPFYQAFAEAWEKSINLGWSNLESLDFCNGQNVFG